MTTAGATRVETPSVLAGGQLVVFSLQGERYALSIDKVQEIIRYTEPRTVDTGTAWLQGVISLRGRIIPICNLAGRLGLSGENSGDAKIVIVDAADGTAGLIVDDVDEVATVTADQLDSTPSHDSDSIQAIVKMNGQLVVLLDPEQLLAGTHQ
jgi:purine-binding chemotaxis protein CheW